MVCPDLPQRIGPWKLNGLPGVILEAYDSKKEVCFMFDNIEKVAFVPKREPVNANGKPSLPLLDSDPEDTDPRIIRVTKNATKTTVKEYARIEDAQRKDPQAFAQAMINAQNPGPSADGRPAPKIDIKAGSGPVVNNPIELPEAK